jgi:hypothetical protein
MTKPTTHHSTLDHDSDLPAVESAVPRGELAVSREVSDPARGHLPLTVWLAAADTESVPACGAGCCQPVSGPLARQLVSACTRMGETVIHLGAADHQVTSAALSAGCLPVVVFADAGRAGVTWTRLARTHSSDDLEVTDLRVTSLADHERPILSDYAGSVGLVVAERTCQQPLAGGGRPDSRHEAEVQDLAMMAGLLQPGGHLAVVTGLHQAGPVADPLPEIITRARAAGLVYLQHIIALRQPARGDRIELPLLGRALAVRQELPECTGLPASARAHSDVLLFTKPKTPSNSSTPMTGPADPLGEATDSAASSVEGEL